CHEKPRRAAFNLLGNSPYGTCDNRNTTGKGFNDGEWKRLSPRGMHAYVSGRKIKRHVRDFLSERDKFQSSSANLFRGAIIPQCEKQKRRTRPLRTNLRDGGAKSGIILEHITANCLRSKNHYPACAVETKLTSRSIAVNCAKYS